jgi:signal transduction histidine kinase
MADRPNLDGRGSFGGVTAAPIDTEAGRLIAVVGGVDPAAVSLGRWLVYNYLNDRLWLPFFTALFTLAGAIAAVPIVLRSIRPTVEAASLVGPGRLQERLPEAGVVRELAPIVRAFNQALDRVSEAFEAKRRFIADVAHELRTPLAVLNLQIDSLPQGLQKIDLQRMVYRLEQMVGQMLDAERMKLAVPRREPVDLVEVAKEAVADITPIALSNGYEVAFHSDVETLVVEGDPAAILRALANLLGNAVAHGGGHGTVEVRVLDSYAVDIADEGPGISLEARDRIFEPFHRERWDKDGCGLGLHLVSEIMSLHGGRVSLLRSSVGATFRLEFRASVEVREYAS